MPAQKLPAVGELVTVQLRDELQAHACLHVRSSHVVLALGLDVIELLPGQKRRAHKRSHGRYRLRLSQPLPGLDAAREQEIPWLSLFGIVHDEVRGQSKAEEFLRCTSTRR